MKNLTKNQKIAIGATGVALFLILMFVLGILSGKQKAPVAASTAQPAASASTSQPEPSPSSTPEEVIEPDLAGAKQANADTVAWLQVPGTDINNPVMQSSNNSDYLHMNEKRQYDIWGCYFADYYSTLATPNQLMQNTVIYGHAKENEDPNEIRFTQLFRFLELDFMRQNQDITLIVGEEEEALTFEIFAVFFTDIDFYYIDPTPSNQGFDAFMNEIASKNEYTFTGEMPTAQDHLLTLSTCATRFDPTHVGNHRLVVMAKQVEAPSENRTIELNAAVKHPG